MIYKNGDKAKIKSLVYGDIDLSTQYNKGDIVKLIGVDYCNNLATIIKDNVARGIYLTQLYEKMEI